MAQIPGAQIVNNFEHLGKFLGKFLESTKSWQAAYFLIYPTAVSVPQMHGGLKLRCRAGHCSCLLLMAFLRVSEDGPASVQPVTDLRPQQRIKPHHQIRVRSALTTPHITSKQHKHEDSRPADGTMLLTYHHMCLLPVLMQPLFT